MKFGEEGKQEMRTGAEPGDQLFGGAELGPLVPAATTGQKRGASANYLPHRLLLLQKLLLPDSPVFLPAAFRRKRSDHCQGWRLPPTERKSF